MRNNSNVNALRNIFADLSNKDFYNSLTSENLSIEQFNHNFSDQAHDLRCLHINIHSLNAKLDEFSNLINSMDVCFDIICLSEIWSTNIQFHSCVLQHDNFIYDLPKSSIVGGVGIFIHKNLQFKIRNDLYMSSTSTNTIENLWIEIINKANKKFIIGCIYRHPNSFVADFIKILESNLCKINKRKYPCILLADTNIDILKMGSQPAVRDYTDSLISNNFLPSLLLPTRVTHSSSTLIDHINFFDNNYDKSTTVYCGNILCDVSDHFPNFF